MNKIKAAIIEDEIPAARLLRDTLLSLRPDWEVPVSYTHLTLPTICSV